MTTNRREFLGQLTSAGMLGMLPMSIGSMAGAIDENILAPNVNAADWDLSWTKKITTKYRTVFDVPEIESGYGVWRASMWVFQYQQTLNVQPKDMTPVLVLRHNGIVLAMNQAYWDKYQIGKAKNVTHPVTEQPSDRNPALLSSARGEQPEQFDAMALDKFIARGGIALACNLAFAEVVGTIAKAEKVGEEEARKQAIAMLVPGVVLQPSGVFAAVHAQDLGCKYLRAS